MRSFRRLPLFLRVASIVGLLFLLASFVMVLAQLVTFIMVLGQLVTFILGGVVTRQELANGPRLSVIAINLALLSLACAFPVNSYSMRFRQPDGGPVLLDSWQRQAQAIALLAALPLCAITLAVVIPWDNLAFQLPFSVSLLAASVLLLAYLWMSNRIGIVR